MILKQDYNDYISMEGSVSMAQMPIPSIGGPGNSAVNSVASAATADLAKCVILTRKVNWLLRT